jgi:hypothetical protein
MRGRPAVRHPRGMRNPIATSALWGCTGMLAGAAGATLAMLPFYPQDPVGYEELAWIVMTMTVAAVLALGGGAVALSRGLRGLPHRGATVAAYLPLAVLLAVVSAGVAALLAPPLARWGVQLWARRRAAAEPGW